LSVIGSRIVLLGEPRVVFVVRRSAAREITALISIGCAIRGSGMSAALRRRGFGTRGSGQALLRARLGALCIGGWVVVVRIGA